MRYKKLLFTRILFLFIPVIGLLIFYAKYRELDPTNIIERLDLLLIALVIALGILILDYVKIINTYRKRTKILNNPELREIPKFVIDSKRINFLDKRLSINPKSIDLTSNGTVELHLNHEKKYLEIKNFWGSRTVCFGDVKYIFLEYDTYNNYTFKEMLGRSGGYHKQIWTNGVIAVLSDGKELKIFEGKLHEYSHEALDEYQITGAYQEKSFLENGKDIIQLFSNFMGKKYFVINYTEGKANAQERLL